MKPIVIIAMVIVLLIPINVVFGIESFVDTTMNQYTKNGLIPIIQTLQFMMQWELKNQI